MDGKKDLKKKKNPNVPAVCIKPSHNKAGKWSDVSGLKVPFGQADKEMFLVKTISNDSLPNKCWFNEMDWKAEINFY